MSRRAPSIRFKLTAWYTAVLIVIVAALSSGIFLFVRDRLHSIASSRLETGYGIVEDVILNSQGDIFDVYHLGHAKPFKINRGDKTLYKTESWKELYLEKKGERGGRGPDIEETFLEPYGALRKPDGNLYLIKTDTIPKYDMTLSFAQETTGLEESIRNLALILLLSFPATLIFAVIGGYFLAGRALSPISRITEKARHITADNLSERLPVPNPDDEIGRLTTVFNDTLARLENSFARLRRFTSDASHELRIPLTSMRSVGEVALQGTPDSDTYKESIGSMLEEVDRLTILVNNLLTLARGDSGRAQIERELLDLTSLARLAVDDLRILAEEKDQTITVDNKQAISVMADRITLSRAVSNVLHNAIRYTQRGGTITVRLTKKSENLVVLDIIDDGPGITPEDREKVFERFYRLDKARSTEEGGTGLGLAIARWAVEANGGAIEFLEKDDPGSWCRITLPSGASAP
jgi:heavy metal sensor kinase